MLPICYPIAVCLLPANPTSFAARKSSYSSVESCHCQLSARVARPQPPTDEVLSQIPENIHSSLNSSLNILNIHLTRMPSSDPFVPFQADMSSNLATTATASRSRRLLVLTRGGQSEQIRTVTFSRAQIHLRSGSDECQTAHFPKPHIIEGTSCRGVARARSATCAGHSA